jgi:uncharacterized protein (DUF2147 family)
MKLLVLWLFATLTAQAQPSVLGKWRSVDDNTGEIKSVVEIFERKDKIFGRIVTLLVGEEPDPVCNKCAADDQRHNQKIIGMEIIRNMKKLGSGYEAGDILDPEDGRVYRCKLWIEGSDLKVRGYWGPFYRTQTWRKST